MSRTELDQPSPRSMLFICCTIFFLVIGATLQWILPIASYRYFAVRDQYPNDINWANWRFRLSFTALLTDLPALEKYDLWDSTTIHGDNVILRFRSVTPGKIHMNFHEVMQFNLNSGQATTVGSPKKIAKFDDVVTNIISRKNFGTGQFMFEGSPHRFATRNSPSERMFCLLQYVDGTWRDTQSYALVPRLPAEMNAWLLSIANNNLVLTSPYAEYDSSIAALEFYYTCGIPLGTQDQLNEFHQQCDIVLNKASDQELLKFGWHHVKIEFPKPADIVEVHQFDASCETEPSLLLTMAMERSWQLVRLYADGRTKAILFPPRHQRFDARFVSQNEKILKLPGRQRRVIALSSDTGRLIQSTSGELYEVLHDSNAGRFYVLKIAGEKADLVGSFTTRLPIVMSLELSYFVLLSILIPSIVLLLVLIISCKRNQTVQYGKVSFATAPLVRRAVARLIDTLIPLSLIVATWLTSGELVGWFKVTIDSIVAFFSQLYQFTTSTGAKFAFKDIQHSLQILGQQFLAFPIAQPMIGILIALQFFQVISQGFTGRTLGKFLMRLRVVSATLRPCGIAHSLLREIAFVVDSMFFMSVLPCAISIFLSPRRQRLGDRLANTYVIDCAAIKGISPIISD